MSSLVPYFKCAFGAFFVFNQGEYDVCLCDGCGAQGAH